MTNTDLPPLMVKVEAAIRLAAELGTEGAFDLIEGRGLHLMRLEILEAITLSQGYRKVGEKS